MEPEATWFGGFFVLQGMNLIRDASTEFKWGIDLGECARIWKGGCIIRAGFLNRIKSAYEQNPVRWRVFA